MGRGRDHTRWRSTASTASTTGFSPAARACSAAGLWKGGDVAVIDGVFVNGSARVVGWFSTVIRQLQSGYIYHYAFAMIFGILLLLTH